jgi:tetratricopeptide (TPR) repeat protein
LLHPWETLAPGSPGPLHAALRDRGSLAQLSVLRGPSPGEARRVVRLVRNAPGIRGLGLGTERILPSLLALETKWGLGTGELGPPITAGQQAGATADHRAARGAGGRLAETVGDDDPLKPVALALAAQAELDRDRAERGLEHARLARRLLCAAGCAERASEIEEPTVAEGRCLMRLRRVEELSMLMREHHLRAPATAATLFLEGFAAAGLKDPERACRLLRTALAVEDRPGFAALPPEARGAGLPYLLGAAELDRGDLGAAGEAFDLALLRDPGSPEARLGRISVLLAQGRLEPMLHELDVLITQRGQDPRIWLAGALLLGQVPQLAAPTVGWLEEARQRFPDNVEIRSRLAEAELRRGGAQEALRALPELGAAGSPSLVATHVAAALACGRALPELASGDLPELGRLVLAWFERWLTYGAIEALDRALLDIARAERALPGLGLDAAAWLEGIGQTEAARGVRSRLSA